MARPPTNISVSAANLVAAGERLEGLVGRGAAREIDLQHALDGLRRVVRLHVAIELAGERRVRAEAAADQDVIALDGVAVLRGLHLAGEQADVADVMLRAGMMAAGEMDVDRPVELDTRLAPARDLLGVALGVGGREPAAGVAGAGDEAGADRARLGGQAELLDRGFRESATCRPGRRRSAGSARP